MFDNFLSKRVFAFVNFCMFVGQLIISKVFLGRSAAVKEGLPIDCDHYPKENSVYLSTCSKEQKHTAQTAPGEWSREWEPIREKCVHGSGDQSSKQCVFVHQTCCVLPAC